MPNIEHRFNNKAYASIEENISSTATVIPLNAGGYNAFLPGWSTGKVMYLTITNAEAEIEIVKVTGFTGNNLTVLRGQDGTTAKAWNRGSVITQRLVAANLSGFIQKEGFRTVAYNPNGVLSAAYPGEKIFQTGDVWWKNISGTTWQLIAGTPDREWVEKGSGMTCNCLVVFNDELYASVTEEGSVGELLMWNGIDGWIDVIPSPGEGTENLWNLVVFSDKLYASERWKGNLLEYDGVNPWAEVVPPVGEGTFHWLKRLIVFDGNLRAGSGYNGTLWNYLSGSSSWGLLAPISGSTTILSLAVFNSKLYAAGNTGNLLEWNGVDAWVQVAPAITGTIVINALAVLSDKLYATGFNTGALLEWNGTDAWVEVAPFLDEYEMTGLAVLNDSLYGCGATTGKLYRWNGTDAWVEVAAQLESYVLLGGSLIAYSGKLYALTTTGELLAW